MRISSFLVAGLLLAAATTTHAQTKAAIKAGMPKSALLKDGAFRRNGATMRLQAGMVSQLSAPLTLENGAVVHADGIIVSPDGTRQQLLENHAVNMQGGIVLLRDDMLTPGAIEQQAQAVTGSTGEIQVPMTNEPFGKGKAELSPRLTAKLLRTEQRLAMLEEMTNILEVRSKTKLTVAASLDRQLSQIDKQLQQAGPAMETPSAVPAATSPGAH